MSTLRSCALLLCLVIGSTALADPIGPKVRLPGFDAEQSKMVYEEGSRIFSEAQQKFAGKLGIKSLSPRALTCGVATMMQGVIEAAAFRQGANLSKAEVNNAKKAIEYLKDVQAKNCDRTGGGGLGTGNEGDKIVKAFYDAYAPRARSLMEEVRERLVTMFESDKARMAKEAILAAAMVAAGLVTAPLWAL